MDYHAIRFIELLRSAITAVANVLKLHVDSIVMQMLRALTIEAVYLESVRFSRIAHQQIGELTMQTHINIVVVT